MVVGCNKKSHATGQFVGMIFYLKERCKEYE